MSSTHPLSASPTSSSTSSEVASTPLSAGTQAPPVPPIPATVALPHVAEVPARSASISHHSRPISPQKLANPVDGRQNSLIRVKKPPLGKTHYERHNTPPPEETVYASTGDAESTTHTSGTFVGPATVTSPVWSPNRPLPNVLAFQQSQSPNSASLNPSGQNTSSHLVHAHELPSNQMTSHNTVGHAVAASHSSQSTVSSVTSPYLPKAGAPSDLVVAAASAQDLLLASTPPSSVYTQTAQTPVYVTRTSYTLPGAMVSMPSVSATGLYVQNQPAVWHDDIWQILCNRVLPLFNGEGVRGTMEEANDLVRRCLSDPPSPHLYPKIMKLLDDGMVALTTKLFHVSDDKLVSRLVEQWSFFFGNALPYIEGVFLPVRCDLKALSVGVVSNDESWNVRVMALRSFRNCVILPMIDRLEEAFAKLFIDFESDKNPAEAAARMLQMMSLLATLPPHPSEPPDASPNPAIARVLRNLKRNWTKFMTSGTSGQGLQGRRRGFVGIQELRRPHSVEGRIFGPVY